MKREQDGIWIIDSEANTTYANERMAQILGTTAAEMTGAPSFAYVFPEDASAAQLFFERKKKGDSAPFRFKLRRKDGSSIDVDIQGTPMVNAAGVFKGIVGTFTVLQKDRDLK